jgi:hypothetical protein
MRFGVFFLLVFCLSFVFQEKGWGYSYGPACQWIRLVGKVLRPQGEEIRGPVGLTVTYQIPGMKHPANLLTQYPLAQEEFKFYLSGFDEEIAGVLFVRPMFIFSKEILFRYYAKSADGKWRSDYHQSRYVPASIPTLDLPRNRDKDYRCNTRIELDPLVLKQK